MHATAILLASFLAAAEPKSEPPPAPVKQALDGYLKAVAAKDLRAMAALADVPWLDRDRQVVRDREGLAKALERVVGQLPAVKGERKVVAVSYKKNRDQLKDEAERKRFDEVLGDDGYLVVVEDEGDLFSTRYLLVRVKGEKVAVVAGPLKPNQMTPTNRIPETADVLLTKADTFEVYSLDPTREPKEEDKREAAKDKFHGWKVLGKTAVKGEDARKRLADALRQGAEDNGGVAAACFIPRHGVRLKAGDKTIDLVICFQCLSVQVFDGDEAVKGFLTTGEPQKEFDAVLKAAGVPLPKQAKEE
jgi:hypothetical protein